MDKKLIRLTEQDLHRIVKESVNRILNEIGDTNGGRYMLGRLQKRAIQRGDTDLDNRIANNYEKNYNGLSGGRAFNSGYDDEGVADKDTIQRRYNAFRQQR